MQVQCVLKESHRAYDRLYTYAVPAACADRVAAGVLVEVPFGAGNRMRDAYVWSVLPPEDEADPAGIKEIGNPLSDGPLVHEDQLALAAFIRGRYSCTYGAALRVMAPAKPSSGRSAKSVFLSDPEAASAMLDEGAFTRVGQIRAVELLLESGEILLADLLSACRTSRSTADTLVRMGVASFGTLHVDKEYGEEKPDPEPDGTGSRYSPTPAQIAAVEAVTRTETQPDEGGKLREYLLFGITGSGKTEVYLNSAEHMLERGKTVLILVPEISLTPQMVGRIRSRFGGHAAVLHSRLTPRERYTQWIRVRDGAARIVVGARSAIFAPLKNLGLIVIDEEQESTYKSENTPRYHARTVARFRAMQQQAVLLLGSATPAVETFHRTQTGASELLRLPGRIGEAVLPDVLIVDMRTELEAGNADLFSRDLTAALGAAFSRGEQAILFLNRRGHSNFMLCRDCGYTHRCEACSVTMTVHRDMGARPALACHYCGRVEPVPAVCPHCGSRAFGRFGAGTQQVEEHFRTVFPGSRTLRMDQDTTTGRTAHADILERFERREADVLIGTQMIAKGHDYPNVTVVGILAADLMLGMSDFRASERAFQLITQAAGRAGRGDRPGRVFIQAYNVDDYAVQAAGKQDYPAFYRQEILFREQFGYPPFGAVGIVTVVADVAGSARDAAAACRERLLELCRADRRLHSVEVSDPARSPLYRLRGKYRWRLVLKAPRAPHLSLLFSTLSDHPLPFDAALILDADPYNLS